MMMYALNVESQENTTNYVGIANFAMIVVIALWSLHGMDSQKMWIGNEKGGKYHDRI